MISQTLLTNVVYSTKTSATPFYSPKFVGDVYYKDQYGIHTFAYFLSSDFVGSVVIQASLVAEPGSNDWATIEATRVTVTTATNSLATTITYTGHVLWIRVAVTAFTAGTIIKIQHSN